MKGEGNWSVQIAWDEIRGHLHAVRRRERGIGQRRSHGTNPRSLTSCEVKEEGNWSVQIAWDESEVTYILRGEGRGELVSTDCMG